MEVIIICVCNIVQFALCCSPHTHTTIELLSNSVVCTVALLLACFELAQLGLFI